MFGVYRYILALAVVASHLFGVMILGWLAVHGFFILSGYLITLILNRDYGYDKAGFSRFMINRALRLFPVYWCVLLGACVLYFLAGTGESAAFFPRMAMPETLGGWIANISLIYPQWIPSDAPLVISPPSWTLTLEWLFYLLMALGLSRDGQKTAVWLALAFFYFGWTHLTGLGLESRYLTLASGALPFALGAGLYHMQPILRRYRSRLEGRTLRNWLSTLVMLNAFICVIAVAENWRLMVNLTFYANMILNLSLIANLALRPRPTGINLGQRIDKIAGDLSYPTYLLHMPVAFGLFHFIFGAGGRSYSDVFLALFMMTVAVCAVLSAILNYFVDRPVQNVRARVRRHSAN